MGSQYLVITVLSNWLVILLISLWLCSKVRLDNFFKYIVLAIFTLHLFVLHQYVLYFNIDWYFTSTYNGEHQMTANLSLVPFHTIIKAFTTPVFVPVYFVQIIGNLLLLTPFAFSLRYLSIANSNFKAVLAMFFTSLGIEVTQLFQTYLSSGYEHFQGRATDIDDLMLNTVGAVIGVLIYKIFMKGFHSRKASITSYT
ncbi:VanZ family protein [Pontibacillus yanchengensis]|uniref:VanZ family protein n=1 Tax=Pontibacillus yanchengensis TaxID=462910 RepID=UPI00136BDB76